MDIRKRLFELKDEEYALFQAELTPGIAPENIIGVRVPLVRSLAKELVKGGDFADFLSSLPHKYYEENMLHGLIISEIKDYALCLDEISRFLPYVDNWAVCDSMSPKVFAKNKTELIRQIEIWSASGLTYTCRFGIEMLMKHYLDADFNPEYLEIPASVKSEDYYVRMMVAWFFATALSKQWEPAVKYLENNRLDAWTHNKTIQKARESFRITAVRKEYLKTLKRNA